MDFLRTTNIIERLNKEFRRRTKPMEIVAGGGFLLYAAGLYQHKDGNTLEVESCRENAL
ncbi:hypothetical protein ACFLTQ_01560 [Chloroflexota bacterium]